MSTIAAMLLVHSLVVADASLPTSALAGNGIKCNARHRCIVPRALVDELLDHTDQLAETVRIVPSLVDGQPAGFKLYALKPHTVLPRLGFTNGDTLQAINGYDLSTPANALIAYTQLRNATHFAVRIVRHGEPLTLTYEIR